jgi:hypothetical protein
VVVAATTTKARAARRDRKTTSRCRNSTGRERLQPLVQGVLHSTEEATEEVDHSVDERASEPLKVGTQRT